MTQPPIAIALYQPDIPQNTGTILRLGACLGLTVHIIEPTGFALSDTNLKRAGMDYLERATMVRHVSWEKFDAWRTQEARRLILLTTKAQTSYLDTAYSPNDILLFGRESSGVPEAVHQTVDQRLTIPMVDGARSINLACSVAMVAGEAIRQVFGEYPTNAAI
ncbi:MAG: tRNA (cytidine(34)-2'-O)-methyltransferase [Pseudomonadota bacterium]